jgi:hypothetical protein
MDDLTGLEARHRSLSDEVARLTRERDELAQMIGAPQPTPAPRRRAARLGFIVAGVVALVVAIGVKAYRHFHVTPVSAGEYCDCQDFACVRELDERYDKAGGDLDLTRIHECRNLAIRRARYY